MAAPAEGSIIELDGRMQYETNGRGRIGKNLGGTPGGR